MKRQLSTSTKDDGFALLFGVVVMMALLLFAGLCLDTGRAYIVKSQLAKAVDGAALGAARMLNSTDPRAEAVSIFRANFPAGFMGTSGADPTAAGDFFSVTTDEANGVNTVQIRATTVMPTTFMALADLTSVQIGATGEATRRMVDMCLVLDTSGSLGWRYPYVRDAAREFIRAFDADNDRFCLVRYSSGAQVLAPIGVTRGYDKEAIVSAVPETIPSDGLTSMAEGLWRGWDELRTVPAGQQSSLRVIVLFTDGAANGVPGIFANSAEARSLNTSDFPKNEPDPDDMTSDTPYFLGMYHTQTGVRNPQVLTTKSWDSTFTHPGVTYLPLTSTHAHGRSAGRTTTFPLQTPDLTVNGIPQSSVRGLRDFNAGAGRYPADIWNTNNAARNLVEIIANAARADGGDYRIRIYTIGMGELVRYSLGTIPEVPEDILRRVANDSTSLDYKAAQLQGKYYFAATEADIGPAFQALQNQIIRLTK